MLFNSIDFAIFCPIIFILYWFVTNRNLKLQNILILIGSYVFYGWWDWRFLGLIIFSTIVDYTIGSRLKITENQTKRKVLLWTSILINLGFLGVFKYYNFFVSNFISAFSFLGMDFQASALDIILPVGISFYTFQTLSYTIDVYKRKLEPTNDIIAFSAFVSFFPQLVAGPIERASDLLPQFYTKRTFEYNKAVDGMRQILWGLFKKVVIADNCATFANQIFDNYSTLNASTLVLGAIFFTFQIYGDFSGYSDIAIGTARLFGFNLRQNFNFPYFSRNMGEFWRRWHISLNTWFRDYLYIPLGGNMRGGVNHWKSVRNIFIVFLVSGFWHGANWTFIIWGFLNALYFLPLLLTKNNRKYKDVVAKGRIFPSFKEFTAIFITFSLTVLAWIFFRAENIGHAFHYISGIFSSSIIEMPHFSGMRRAFITILLIVFFMIIEWKGREGQYAIEKIGLKWKPIFRYAMYYIIIFLIVRFAGEEQQFIYFQF